MLKKELRKIYAQKRKELTPSLKDKLEDLMLIHFQSLHLEIPDTVMSFLPIEEKGEYNPVLIEEYCFFRNPATTLIYPLMNDADRMLRAIAVKEDTVFELNELNIEEPVNGKEIDPEGVGMILLPLLAFDERGFRVGYGKGYYDAFIKKCRPEISKTGFSFFAPDKIDDTNSFDEKMNFCITPEQIFEF